jgi:hypothetical protein
MKQTRSRQVLGVSLLALAIATLFSVSSCRKLTPPVDPVDTNYAPPPPPPPPPPMAGPATSLPSAGVIGIRATGSTGNVGDFEIDLLVNDSSGNAITNLSPSAISIPSGIDTIFGQRNTFTQTGVNSAMQMGLGAFSAEILLDQTGSIRKTDPFNLRLLASKLLLQGVALLNNPALEVQLTTFQDSLRIPNGYMRSYGPFTSNVLPLLPIVDGLANQVGGGTPLYDAMYNCVDSLTMLGHNPNKVLLVFTDGQDNESDMYPPYVDAWAAIRYAKQNGVHVFGVALQVGIDTALINAAVQTGGGVMHTDDAKQMVSFYRAMPKVMQGQSAYYKTKWHVALPAGYTLSHRSISGNMKITLPDNSVVAAPFAVSFP